MQPKHRYAGLILSTEICSSTREKVLFLHSNYNFSSTNKTAKHNEDSIRSFLKKYFGEFNDQIKCD